MTRDESWAELQNTMPLEQVFSETQMILVRHVHDAAFANGRTDGAMSTRRDVYEPLVAHHEALVKAMVGK